MPYYSWINWVWVNSLQHKPVCQTPLLLVQCDGADSRDLGYPIICIPLGVGANGLPFSLSVQGNAWSEGKLIKWASAIEDLLSRQPTIPPEPRYKNDLAENIPIWNNHVS